MGSHTIGRKNINARRFGAAAHFTNQRYWILLTEAATGPATSLERGQCNLGRSSRCGNVARGFAGGAIPGPQEGINSACTMYVRRYLYKTRTRCQVTRHALRRLSSHWVPRRKCSSWEWPICTVQKYFLDNAITHMLAIAFGSALIRT